MTDSEVLRLTIHTYSLPGTSLPILAPNILADLMMWSGDIRNDRWGDLAQAKEEHDRQRIS